MLNDDPRAVLVDCRTDAEWRFVGVPDLTGLGPRRRLHRVEPHRRQQKREFRRRPDVRGRHPAWPNPSERPVVFLCRSGNRSIGAAEAATEAGIAPSYNVLDGFEGDLDERQAPRRHRLEGRRPALEAVVSRRRRKPGALGAHSGQAAGGRQPGHHRRARRVCCGRASKRPPRRSTRPRATSTRARPRRRRRSPARSTGTSTPGTATRRSRCSRSGCG